MSGWGLRRFDACKRKIQTQEGVRFVQVWCLYDKDWDAWLGEVCAGLMLVLEGFRRKREWDLCWFDACMRRIQTQVWVRFVPVWCTNDKDWDAWVGEVCAVWCLYEKDSDARGSEVCAGLMLVWEGFRRRCVWGLCRFDACMRRIQTQVRVRFVQVWCTNDKDWDAWVGEVCAGLMLVWEGFRRKREWGLCRLDACMRRIQTQVCVRFMQVWCLYEKDSDAGVGEVCAGLMHKW